LGKLVVEETLCKIELFKALLIHFYGEKHINLMVDYKELFLNANTFDVSSYF
jgi:hypothetical protein